MKRLDKPYGYCEYVLALDCETSGLFKKTDDPSYDPSTKKQYQAVSVGLVVADTETLKPIDELYVEIKWNKQSGWQAEAERIHGLSKEYLEENGMSQEEAVKRIGSFIMQYWDPTVEPIRTLGYNARFDICFVRRLFRKFDIEINLGRCYDLDSIGFGTFGTFNSNELFHKMGLEKRDKHNALKDAKIALKVVRQIRLIWKKYV